jgi:uncharacterized membrane protein (DUF106 family)
MFTILLSVILSYAISHLMYKNKVAKIKAECSELKKSIIDLKNEINKVKPHEITSELQKLQERLKLRDNNDAPLYKSN